MALTVDTVTIFFCITFSLKKKCYFLLRLLIKITTKLIDFVTFLKIFVKLPDGHTDRNYNHTKLLVTINIIADIMVRTCS